VDFKLEIPDPGGKDDVWAFGSPGVGFGLLGVWCTRQGMAGRDPGHGYQSVAGCRRVHILIHFVWKKEMERRWCNHFFNLVILCYTQYIYI